MVYCGKPSGGCHACRERKSRCDKLPEGCTQCKRAKRVCPGYRQPGDVIFHNENEKVVRKAKAKAAKTKAKRDAEDRAWTSPGALTPDEDEEFLIGGSFYDEAINRSMDSVPPQSRAILCEASLLPRAEDVADGFFIQGYASRIPGESGPGRFDYLADKYNEYSLDAGLRSSIRAVGFASAANTMQSGAMLDKARYHYMQAVRWTNRALASNEIAKKDTTLLSILVLGIFETMTGTHRRSLKDWSQHINGAAAVIKLRGDEQLDSIAGRRMLFQVTSNLLIVCIAQEKALPDYLLKLLEAAIAKIHNPDPALLVQRTMIRAAQLRSDVRGGNIEDPNAVLNEALKLDSALVKISQNPPDGWAYEVVYTSIPSSYVWKGTYHVYPDCWIAQLFNALRTIRILLNELVRSVLLNGFAADPPHFREQIYVTQLQQTTQTLYDVQDDILYTVPQHLFKLPQPEHIRHHTIARSNRANVEEAVVPLENMSPAQQESHGQWKGVLDSQQYSDTTSLRPLLPKPSSELVPPSLPIHVRASAQSTSENCPTTSLASWTEVLTTDPLSVPLLFDENQRKQTVAARTYGGNFLMWPLYVAGNMDISTQEVRDFAVRNLRDVGDELGIKQGWVLADLLEKNIWEDDLI